MERLLDCTRASSSRARSTAGVHNFPCRQRNSTVRRLLDLRLCRSAVHSRQRDGTWGGHLIETQRRVRGPCKKTGGPWFVSIRGDVIRVYWATRSKIRAEASDVDNEPDSPATRRAVKRRFCENNRFRLQISWGGDLDMDRQCVQTSHLQQICCSPAVETSRSFHRKRLERHIARSTNGLHPHVWVINGTVG